MQIASSVSFLTISRANDLGSGEHPSATCFRGPQHFQQAFNGCTFASRPSYTTSSYTWKRSYPAPTDIHPSPLSHTCPTSSDLISSFLELISRTSPPRSDPFLPRFAPFPRVESIITSSSRTYSVSIAHLHLSARQTRCKDEDGLRKHFVSAVPSLRGTDILSFTFMGWTPSAGA
ncbi:hypothetical protein C8J57DRAFT_1512466 [Mycena rebaudengoi]|nr:hypothetical protein C8J57DRAFT_1512466 [Mycena rebaudengoi]